MKFLIRAVEMKKIIFENDSYALYENGQLVRLMNDNEARLCWLSGEADSLGLDCWDLDITDENWENREKRSNI